MAILRFLEDTPSRERYIKPLQFVLVSDGRKLRKEKRPAPIDFVEDLSISWILNFNRTYRCYWSERKREILIRV